MKLKRFLLYAAGAMILSVGSACSDDTEDWPTVDGKNPTMKMASTLVGCRAGSTFHIKGTVEDADGINTISLRCPSLYLDKVIDIPSLYGEPLKTYELDYKVDVDAKEAGDIFKVLVTVTDVAGNTTTETVTVDLDGDVDAPLFTVAPDNEMFVVLTDKAVLDLTFTVKDDRELGSVSASIDGVWNKTVTDFSNPGEYTFSESVTLPAANAEYTLLLSAADTWGNTSTRECVVRVSDTPDYSRMWLSDVKTVAELNSDVMGVPMLIDRVAPYKYEARYYNEKAGTEIYFLPQRTDFLPVRFGIDPADMNKLSGDPSSSRPFVLDQEKVYYLITLDLMVKEYTISTYSIDEAIDPIPHPFGTESMDFHENGESYVEFWFGYTTSGPQDISRFVQDPENPHRFWLEQPLTFSAGRHTGFIIHNYHADGWWNYCTWRADDEQDPETVDYYGNYTNPQWQGKRGADYWFKPLIPADGQYQLYFDAHLGRAKIVPVR
jgi:hypothetical protein